MLVSRWHGVRVAFTTVFVLCVASISSASITLNLTTDGSFGTINGAIYEQIDPQTTGTGTIGTFVQIDAQGNATEAHAYNTTVNNVLDNGSSDQFNRSITLADVLIVSVGGLDYRQFLLDINESRGGGNEFLSLDEIQLFVGGTANSSVESFTGDVLDHDGTLVYQMDAGMDNWVALDSSLNSGSGSGDMFLYVLDSLFDPFGGADVVTLYSLFGQQGDVDATEAAAAGVPAGEYGTSDGFEEWAVPGAVIPEPVSFAVWSLLLGSVGLATARRYRAG